LLLKYVNSEDDNLVDVLMPSRLTVRESSAKAAV
jgi:hypothetical protein